MPGEVHTLAGSGQMGFSADGESAARSPIAEPFGVVVGPDEAIYFCELGNHRIRRIDPERGTLSTVVGTGVAGNDGDGGPALDAGITQPYEVRFDRQGNLVFVDMVANVVRRVNRSNGVVEPVAGTSEAGFSGDGGNATLACMDQPHSIEFDAEGYLYVCDIRNHRIRRIAPDSGIIETFAGTGEQAPTPDGAPRAGTPLNGPRAMAFDGQDNMFLALREGNVVLRWERASDTFHHVAGTGERGYRGNGGSAKLAELSGPKGIALGPDGAIYIADTESHTIRRIDGESGIITTVIGDGRDHDGPDGDPQGCGLARPHGVFVDAGGAIYVGDSENHRIRRLG